MSSHSSPRRNLESTMNRAEDVPKMSLLAQFDDFCRRVASDDDEVLSAMLDFVRNQEVCRQQWEAAETCCNRLADDNESLVQANSKLQAKLQHTRDVLEKEVQRRLKCEAQLRAVQSQLDQIRYCVFGQGFQNREDHMVTVLRNVLSQENFESTMADKSVQSVLSPTGTSFSVSANHSDDMASMEVSRGARRMLLGMPATQSPLPVAGMRQLSPGKALSGSAPSGSVSHKTAPPAPLYSAPVPARAPLPGTVPLVQVPSEPASSGAVLSGYVTPGSAVSGPGPVVSGPSKAAHSRGVSSGIALPGSVTTGSALSGSVPLVLGPPRAVPSRVVTSRAACSDVDSSGYATRGLASRGPVPTAPLLPGVIPSGTATSSAVSSRATSSLRVTPPPTSLKLYPPGAPPLYPVSPGKVLSGSLPSGPVSSEAASSSMGHVRATAALPGSLPPGPVSSEAASSSKGHVHAAAALHAGSVNARSILTKSARFQIVSAGLTPADPVPLPWTPGAPGQSHHESVPSRSPGSRSSKRSAAEKSSSGLGSGPAKVHFELSNSQKMSTGNNSCETSGRGEVFATTMTMVAGEPGYVATVTSQMEGSISSSSSQQRFRRSHSGPALLIRHSSQKAAVPQPSSLLDESGVEEESGFVSRLERLGPLNCSTPVPRASEQQQSHAFVSRPAVNPENCIACDKRIRFYKASFQCSTCGVICHPECENLVSLPCGARAPRREASCAGGSAAANSSAGVLADYAPSQAPFVPPLVVHCIREVERRCLQERGPLYGAAAPQEEVDALLGRLLSGRDLPALGNYSLPVVCGALVKFLGTLRETVITKSVWPLLAEAAVTGEEDKENRVWKFLDAARKLPAANRAVLSMLLVHLCNLSATSLGSDGRSLDELATVFAPVVVGCSKSSPNAEEQERDRHLQDLIMHCFLGVPDVYWKDSAAAPEAVPQEPSREGGRLRRAPLQERKA